MAHTGREIKLFRLYLEFITKHLFDTAQYALYKIILCNDNSNNSMLLLDIIVACEWHPIILPEIKMVISVITIPVHSSHWKWKVIALWDTVSHAGKCKFSMSTKTNTVDR